MIKSNNIIAGFNLLINQRSRWSHKNDLSLRKPAIKVVHHNSSNEGLSETGRQSNERVLEQRLLGDSQLILTNWIIDWITRRWREIDEHTSTTEPLWGPWMDKTTNFAVNSFEADY